MNAIKETYLEMIFNVDIHQTYDIDDAISDIKNRIEAGIVYTASERTLKFPLHISKLSEARAKGLLLFESEGQYTYAVQELTLIFPDLSTSEDSVAESEFLIDMVGQDAVNVTLKHRLV